MKVCDHQQGDCEHLDVQLNYMYIVVQHPLQGHTK